MSGDADNTISQLGDGYVREKRTPFALASGAGATIIQTHQCPDDCCQLVEVTLTAIETGGASTKSGTKRAYYRIVRNGTTVTASSPFGTFDDHTFTTSSPALSIVTFTSGFYDVKCAGAPSENVDAMMIVRVWTSKMARTCPPVSTLPHACVYR